MTQPPDQPSGRHLNPEEFAKEMAKQLAASSPKGRKPRSRRRRKRRDGDRTPVVGRLISWTAIVGICFGAGIGIAALVVWLTGANPGVAADTTTTTVAVTFPGQVTTTSIANTTTTTVGESTTTIDPGTTTTFPAGTPTTATTLPQSTTTTRPPAATTTSTTTTTAPTTTTTTAPTTTTTTLPPQVDYVRCNNGACVDRLLGASVTITYACVNATTCTGEVATPGGGFSPISSGTVVIVTQAGQYQIRVTAAKSGAQSQQVLNTFNAS